MSILIGQKLVENAKIHKLKCDISSNFQTMWTFFSGFHKIQQLPQRLAIVVLAQRLYFSIKLKKLPGKMKEHRRTECMRRRTERDGNAHFQPCTSVVLQQKQLRNEKTCPWDLKLLNHYGAAALLWPQSNLYHPINEAQLQDNNRLQSISSIIFVCMISLGAKVRFGSGPEGTSVYYEVNIRVHLG